MSNNVQSLIVGILIGVLASAFGVILQFLLAGYKDRKLNRKRRIWAYARLQAILARIGQRESIKKRVSAEELRELEGIVANNYDVLDDSTLDAWNFRKMSELIVYGQGEPHHVVEFDRFIDDVRVHYERFKKESPYHHLANEQDLPFV